MHERQTRALASFSSVLSNSPALTLDSAPELPGLLEELGLVVHEIRTEGGKQHVAVRSRYATSARAQVLVFRNDYMLTLAKLVRPLFAGEPGMLKSLKVPHKRAAPEEILEAADRMLTALRPHAKLLTTARIDPKRVTGLRAEMRRLKKIVRAAGAAGADRGAPTQRLKPLFARARRLVTAIDGLQSSFRRPGDLDAMEQLNKWKRLSRVGKKLGRPRKRRGGNPDAGRE